jgi:hypothetical protein
MCPLEVRGGASLEVGLAGSGFGAVAGGMLGRAMSVEGALGVS